MTLESWAQDPEPPVESATPIALRPPTYVRHARVVDYVERTTRARYPYPERGRTTGASAGAWAKLANGSTITACSGLTLGSGTVTLCSRSGAALTADGESITVYNAGDAITTSGADRAVKLTWTDGVWSAARCG